MQSPGEGGDPGDYKEPVADEELRRWLLSENGHQILLALAELDRQHRFKTGKWLVGKFGGRLHFEEMRDIWVSVGDALVDMARRKSIDMTSEYKLSTLVYRIAHRKASKRVRDHGRFQNWEDWDDIVNDGDSLLELLELVEVLRVCIQRLREPTRGILDVWLKMLLEDGFPPSIKDLTKRYNDQDTVEKKLSEATVERRLAVGKQKLRDDLGRGGMQT